MEYGCQPDERGGLTLTVSGQSFPIESLFSYPNGGDNALLAGQTTAKPEPDWAVSTERLSPTEYRVRANGKYYAILRNIKLLPNRVAVRDEITNRTSEDVGIIMRTSLRAAGEHFPIAISVATPVGAYDDSATIRRRSSAAAAWASGCW